jgi:hypothetical protein
MAEFERTAAPDGEPARGVPLRQPAPLSMGGSTEPMQQALDGWYREQPAAFTRAAEPEADGDALDPAERAIALNHLLAYGRLAGERELAAFREDGGKGGGAVAGPLLQRLQTQTMALLNRAPAALHPALGAGLAASNERLAGKAAAIEAALTGRRQAEALEQSVSLGAALLRQDPEQYEILLADAGDMVEGLGLEEGPRQALGQGIRKRLAEAVLLAQADPVVGDPARADQELRRGRFRDAFDAEEIAAWRELMTANRARAAAEAARREQDAGIVAEIKLLNRLGAAGRAEAPMPTAAEIETVFPGEGAARLAAAARNRQRSVYAAGIATQSAEDDRAWIEAAKSDEDRAVRVEAVQAKNRAVARSGGGNLLKLYPALGEAIEEGLQDFGKLGFAIETYQRQLARLGVPPGERTLLPTESLQRLADQYEKLNPPHDRLVWLEKLLGASGKYRAKGIVEGLAHARPGFDPNAIHAVEALADSVPWIGVLDILQRSERDEDFIDGYRLEVRLNPETRKYEEWEVSPQGRERARLRRFAGAFFKVETRVDPSTGTAYEVEVFPDGSERPRLPADQDYPSLSGMALETWRIAAYEQFVNPDTWRLATPAEETVQQIYRDQGLTLPDRYFVGPNAIVYERSGVTEEPDATKARRWRETIGELERQDAALAQAVKNGSFSEVVGVALGPEGFLIPGVWLGIKGVGGSPHKYGAIPFQGRLGIEGIDISTHPAFAKYRELNDAWIEYRENPANKRSDAYKAENVRRGNAAGLEFQRATLGLLDSSKYEVLRSGRLRAANVEVYALPDGTIRPYDLGSAFHIEVKSTNLANPLALPRLTGNQSQVLPAAAAEGEQVLIIFPRNGHIEVRQIRPSEP